MKKLLSSLPVQLLVIIALAALFGTTLPVVLINSAFTVSSVLKELLEFFLPFVVFFFVSTGVMAFERNSVVMIGLLLGTVFVSNCLTSLYAYSIGSLFVSSLGQQGIVCSAPATSLIFSYFSLGLPMLVRSEHALLAALSVGVWQTFMPRASIGKKLHRGKAIIEWGMNTLFIPVLPLYVFGFFLKMVNEMPVRQLCSLYGTIFLLAIVLHIVYLTFAYFIAAGCNIRRTIDAIFVAIPSYVTALGTMSSVAALPVSVVCAEKNSQNRPLSQFAMPILANIHLMGDSVSVPLFCIATMYAFVGVVPAFHTYLIFIGYFCVTMLAVSGIPGGGIIVMLPLLKSLFGFTPEMLSMMTALYLLQDGFGTAANVMGDGALVMVLNRISRALRIQSENT